MNADNGTEKRVARQYASLQEELVHGLSERDAAYVQRCFSPERLQRTIDDYVCPQSDPVEELRVMRTALHDMLSDERQKNLNRGAMFGNQFGKHKSYWSDGFDSVRDSEFDSSEHVRQRVYLGDGFGAVVTTHKDYSGRQRRLYIVDIDQEEVIDASWIGGHEIVRYTHDEELITVTLSDGRKSGMTVHIDRKSGHTRSHQYYY